MPLERERATHPVEGGMRFDGNEFVQVDREGHVAVVRLDRPPVNALVTAVYEEIAGTFDTIGRRESGFRSVLFTAAGKYFCVGKDLKAISDEREDERNEAVRAAFGAVRNCPIPVVAAVNGPALGAGLTLTLSSDLIVASTDAVFGLPEIDAGLAGGFAIAQRGLNSFQAKRMYFTGERLTADEMYRLGVLLKVVEPSSLLAAGMEVAEVLAKKSPLAMRAAKWSANEVEKLTDYEQAYRVIESRQTVALSATRDHREAVAAFREGREPRFTGE